MTGEPPVIAVYVDIHGVFVGGALGVLFYFLFGGVMLAIVDIPGISHGVIAAGCAGSIWLGGAVGGLYSGRIGPMVEVSAARIREAARHIERLPPELITPQAAADTLRSVAGGAELEDILPVGAAVDVEGQHAD